MSRVGFLHTSDLHPPVFQGLVESIAPEVEVCHSVQEALLERAVAEGLTDEVADGFSRAVSELVERGCGAIACTCSTLGVLAESLRHSDAVVQRIDRAVADEAMRYQNVLVLAAIESAGVAADELLDASRISLGRESRWIVMLVPGAWPMFQAGEVEAYAACVADFANQFGAAYDAIFLSQASMQAAAPRCEHHCVLTSPEPGVRRLLASL